MSIPFVRILRLEGWERGLAVDRSGKIWQGFTSNRTDDEIRLTGVLGSVGLCFCCLSRVYQGWECINHKRDSCDDCIVLPPPNKIFVIKEPITEELWNWLIKEFKHEHFGRKRLTRRGITCRSGDAGPQRRAYRSLPLLRE